MDEDLHPSTTPSSEFLAPAIETASAADAEAIAMIGTATFVKSFGHSMPAEHLHAYLAEAYTPTAILNDLANTQNRFFVARLRDPASAEGNGQVVGFIQMKLGTTEPCLPRNVSVCELNRIYVSLDHAGGGIGHLMMERGLQWAREHLLNSRKKEFDGAAHGVNGEERRIGVWLGVWEENTKAQRFYRRWGFESVGTHEFAIGSTTQTDFVMVKWL